MLRKGAKIIIGLVLALVSTIVALILVPTVNWEVPTLQVESDPLTSKKAQFSAAESIVSESEDVLFTDAAEPRMDSLIFSEQEIEINEEVYKIAYQYWNLSYNAQPISALVPLAHSIVELGVINPLALTSFIPPTGIESAEDVHSIGCVRLYETQEWRDRWDSWYGDENAYRGPLQESPTYGALTGDQYPELKSEDQLLTEAGYPPGDSSYRSSFTTNRGDRFSVAGSTARLANSDQQLLDWLDAKGFDLVNSEMFVAMSSLKHGASSLFRDPNYNAPIGSWVSSDYAYEYCKAISSGEILKDIQARAAEVDVSLPIVGDTQYKITWRTAQSWRDEWEAKGWIEPIDCYRPGINRNSRHKDCYPIMAVYAYCLLSKAYFG